MGAESDNSTDSPVPDLKTNGDGGEQPTLPDVTDPAAVQAAADEKAATLMPGEPVALPEDAAALEGGAGEAAAAVAGEEDLADKKPVTRVTEDEAGNRCEATFVGDELNGESKIYDSNGTLIQNALFTKGVLNGPLFAYDAAGQLIQKAYFINGKLNGKMTLYNQGRIRAQFYYKDDLMHGKARYYDDAESLTCAEIYKDGVYHGVNKWYDSHGNLLVKAPYKEGSQQGLRIEYYTTGTPRERAPYKDNLLDGEVRRYYPDGTLMQKVLYQKGKQVGQLIEYDQGGYEKKDSWWVRFARWVQGKKKADVDTPEGGGGLRG